jgi:hypothetical protein
MYVELRGLAMIRSALDSMLFKNLLLHHKTAIYMEQINHFFDSEAISMKTTLRKNKK